MGFKDYINEYEFECVLPGVNKTVKFKPLITKQIKKLSTYEKEVNPIVIEEAFDELISSSIITEDFNIDNIYIQDRIFLLIEIRKKSKSDIYEYQFKCPKCKTDIISAINFSDFNISKRDDSVDKSIKMSDNMTIFIDHITRGEQKEAYKTLDRTLSVEDVQTDMVMNNIAAGIKEVETPDGRETLAFEDKKYLLDSSNVYIFNEIKKWYDNNDFGIDLTYQMKCTQCDYISEKVPMEIDNNFF